MGAGIPKNIFAIVLGLIAVEAAQWNDLPKEIKRCRLYDPKLNECLLKATEEVKPWLIKGIPQLNVPAIEPFHIPEITLEQGTPALNFKALLTNVVVNGLSNYKFSKFDFDVPNLQWFCKCTISPLEINGDYTVTGRVLIAPIQGKGKFFATIESSDVTAYQKVKRITKNGEEFVTPVLTNTTINVGGPKVKIDGLFDGNEEIGNVTNRVINENIQVLFEDLRPVIEKVITTIMEDGLLKSLEDNVPFKKLYPVD